MEPINLSNLIPSIIGWLFALVPVAGYFISNWFTVGASTWFRITPSFCVAALPQVVTYTAIGIVVTLVSFGIILVNKCTLLFLLVLGLTEAICVIVLVARIKCEVPPIAFLFLFIGAVCFFALSIQGYSNGHIGLPGGFVFTICELNFTLEEVLLVLVELCFLFYLSGVFDTIIRKDYLVDPESDEIILANYASNNCLIGKISAIRALTKNGKVKYICVVDNIYTYGLLTGQSRKLTWCRFSSIELNRNNFDPSKLLKSAK